MINFEDAIQFLNMNQPFPEDDQCENEFETLRLVLDYFQNNHHPECVPLFLNCFGKGDGRGLYVMIEQVITQYDADIVMPHLLKALYSDNASVRYWCAQVCESYNHEDLIDGLINVFENGDIDSKCASLTALSGYKNDRVIELCNKTLRDEKDEVLLGIAGDILN